MQARARRLAERLGYVPNTSSQRLVARRWTGKGGSRRESLAVLRLEGGSSMLTGWEKTAVAEMRALGYGAELLALGDYSSAKGAANVLRARGVRGLLVEPTVQTPAADWRRFPWQEFCAVQVRDGRLPPFGRAVFTLDATGNMLEAAARLRASGARSLAFLPFLLDPPSSSDLRYLAAWSHVRAQCEEAGVRTWDAVKFSLSHGVERMFTAMAEWVRKMRPEGVVVQGLGLEIWLSRLGIEVGRDVQFVTLECGNSRCAGFDVKMDEILAHAAHHLHFLVCHDQRGTVERPDMIMKAATWVPGASLRDPPTRTK